MTPLTPEELTRIEALANAATPEPWHWNAAATSVDDANGGFLIFGRDSDGVFCAAAREAVPRLVAALRELLAPPDGLVPAETFAEQIDREWETLPDDQAPCGPAFTRWVTERRDAQHASIHAALRIEDCIAGAILSYVRMPTGTDIARWYADLEQAVVEAQDGSREAREAARLRALSLLDAAAGELARVRSALDPETAEQLAQR